MKLSIIIPVYDEKNTIVELLDRVVRSPIKMDYEIIVVDDGSKDGTGRILDDYKTEFDGSGYGSQLKLIHKENGGKGSAIYEGLKQATGDIVGIQDADLEYFPEDYTVILDPMLRGVARVSYGSRFMGRYIPQGMTLKNFIGNMTLNVTAWMLFSFGCVTDLATCYKFWFRGDIPIEDLKCEGFEFCPVHFAAAWKRGLKPFEVPIRFNARWYEKGKKITTMNGFYELWTFIKLGFKYGRFKSKI
jgi:glycosyltransferase involved in cell wall biosynthesis